jgi:glycosyltransferase involved in cell wall biosynthesis
MSNSSGTILFISNDASRTGAPIYLLRLLRWLRDNRDDSFCTLVGTYGALAPQFEELGETDYFEPRPTVIYRVLRRLKWNRAYRASHQRTLRAALSRRDIRLVYCNTIANGEILQHLSFLRCPVICHVHELESSIAHFGPGNMALIKEHASQFIATSQSVKSNLSGRHGIPEERIRLIFGGIPIEQVPRSGSGAVREAVRRELGIPLQSKLVCGAGSPGHRKGTDLFLRVAEDVRHADGNGNVHFVWVGGNSDSVHRVRKEIESSPLRDVVHFVGSKAEMNAYYDASDMFLLSSREDPFPLVMLEAASRGLPIVCFAESGGGPEFVEDDAGTVVPGFDTAKMAQEVMRLLSAPQLSRRIGKAGQQKVANRYTLDICAAKIAEVIKEALGESRGPERHAEASAERFPSRQNPPTPLLAPRTRL